MHSSDEQYQNILKKRIEDINKDIEKLRNRQEKTKILYNQIESSIKGLEIEKGKITKLLNDKVQREHLNENGERVLSIFDNKYEKIEEKQENYEEKIDELNKLKSELGSKYQKRKIDKRVERIEKKIDKLKKKNVRIGKIQRTIMYPKSSYKLIRQSIVSKAEGRVKNYEELLEENKKVIETSQEKNLFNPIQNVIYQIKGNIYKSKLERSKEALEVIKNMMCPMNGARVTEIDKNTADLIRAVHEKINNAPLGLPAPTM